MKPQRTLLLVTALMALSTLLTGALPFVDAWGVYQPVVTGFGLSSRLVEPGVQGAIFATAVAMAAAYFCTALLAVLSLAGKSAFGLAVAQAVLHVGVAGFILLLDVAERYGLYLALLASLLTLGAAAAVRYAPAPARP